MPGGLGVWALLVAAGVIVITMLFVWLLARDKTVAKTSFGVFVERHHYGDGPELAEQTTVASHWPVDDA